MYYKISLNTNVSKKKIEHTKHSMFIFLLSKLNSFIFLFTVVNFNELWMSLVSYQTCKELHFHTKLFKVRSTAGNCLLLTTPYDIKWNFHKLNFHLISDNLNNLFEIFCFHMWSLKIERYFKKLLNWNRAEFSWEKGQWCRKSLTSVSTNDPGHFQDPESRDRPSVKIFSARTHKIEHKAFPMSQTVLFLLKFYLGTNFSFRALWWVLQKRIYAFQYIEKQFSVIKFNTQYGYSKGNLLKASISQIKKNLFSNFVQNINRLCFNKVKKYLYFKFLY